MFVLRGFVGADETENREREPDEAEDSEGGAAVLPGINPVSHRQRQKNHAQHQVVFLHAANLGRRHIRGQSQALAARDKKTDLE